MKNKKLLVISSLSVLLAPSLVFGALTGSTNLLKEIYSILQTLDNLIFALALVYFFWGVAEFILKSNDDKAREEGRKKIMWGIVALFVLASWWGIVSVLGGLVGIPTNSSSSSFGGVGVTNSASFNGNTGGGNNGSGVGTGYSGSSGYVDSGFYQDPNCGNGSDSDCVTTGFDDQY